MRNPLKSQRPEHRDAVLSIERGAEGKPARLVVRSPSSFGSGTIVQIAGAKPKAWGVEVLLDERRDFALPDGTAVSEFRIYKDGRPFDGADLPDYEAGSGRLGPVRRLTAQTRLAELRSRVGRCQGNLGQARSLVGEAERKVSAQLESRARELSEGRPAAPIVVDGPRTELVARQGHVEACERALELAREELDKERERVESPLFQQQVLDLEKELSEFFSGMREHGAPLLALCERAEDLRRKAATILGLHPVSSAPWVLADSLKNRLHDWLTSKQVREETWRR